MYSLEAEDAINGELESTFSRLFFNFSARHQGKNILRTVEPESLAEFATAGKCIAASSETAIALEKDFSELFSRIFLLHSFDCRQDKDFIDEVYEPNQRWLNSAIELGNVKPVSIGFKHLYQNHCVVCAEDHNGKVFWASPANYLAAQALGESESIVKTRKVKLRNGYQSLITDIAHQCGGVWMDPEILGEMLSNEELSRPIFDADRSEWIVPAIITANYFDDNKKVQQNFASYQVV